MSQPKSPVLDRYNYSLTVNYPPKLSPEPETPSTETSGLYYPPQPPTSLFNSPPVDATDETNNQSPNA